MLCRISNFYIMNFFKNSFRSVGESLGLKVEMFEDRLVVCAPFWKRALSTDSTFCDALVACGILTQKQMEHAARRYRLGASKSRGVIFWQIDHEERIHNGKIMYYRDDCHRDKEHKPTWVSYLLQKRHRFPDNPPCSHTLFGLHLLPSNSPLGPGPFRRFSQKLTSGARPRCAVVEAEKTAVILSEMYPQYLWLATGGLGETQPEKFRPLRGCEVILFPDTDPDGIAFKRWTDAAAEVNRQLWWEGCPKICVSDLLERCATPEQKCRKIDLADFYLETVCQTD